MDATGEEKEKKRAASEAVAAEGDADKGDKASSSKKAKTSNGDGALRRLSTSAVKEHC